MREEFLKLEHHERYDSRRSHRLGALAFFFGFTDAFLVYILSSYFEEALGNSNVSVFYLITFSAIFFLLFFLHSFVGRFGGSSLFCVLLFLGILAHIPIIFLPVSLWGALAIMVYLVTTTLAWVNLDMILEGFSEDKQSGRIRGLHLTAMNAGLLLAPFLSTTILDHLGFSGVFLASFVFCGLLLIFAIISLIGVNTKFKAKSSPMEIFRKVRARTDILRIYAVSFAMEFFYAIMIVYTPIRLHELGMSWGDIGIIFTIMLIPFVLVQYPLGVLADKRMGEKELIIAMLFLASLSTATIAWISNADVLLWSAGLFATRIGIAGIEVLRDAYFYKRIDANDGDLIAFFRTARSFANIIAAGITGIWLLFFSVSSIFFLPAILLLVVGFSAFFIKDNKSERELARVS